VPVIRHGHARLQEAIEKIRRQAASFAVAETGAIAARLLPLTAPADPAAPLPAGTLPAESDLLLPR